MADGGGCAGIEVRENEVSSLGSGMVGPEVGELLPVVPPGLEDRLEPPPDVSLSLEDWGEWAWGEWAWSNRTSRRTPPGRGRPRPRPRQIQSRCPLRC